MARYSERVYEQLHPKIKREKKVPAKFIDYNYSTSSFFTAPEKSVSPAHKSAVNKKQLKRSGASTKRIYQAKKSTQSVLKSLNIKTMKAEDYIASSRDKPHLFKVQTVSLLKDLRGQGLYAAQDIPAEVCFGEYTGEVSSLEDYSTFLEESDDADPSYAMEVGGNIIDAIKKGNFTRFINFSDAQANAAFISGYIGHRKTVFLKTIKPVGEGKQLLIDYNKYDEHASLDYYFLNPEDGWISTEELYQQQQKHYRLNRCRLTSPILDLSRRDKIYATVIGEMILNGVSLESLGVDYDATVNLPYLKTDRSGNILDATKTNLFTPLMLACALGQIGNIEWLIKHGASISQQQNHSGNCPLFIALYGYNLNIKSRPMYMGAMSQLIKLKASLNVHDRFDKTFLHQAIFILNPIDFEAMIRLISSEAEHDFLNLFDYLDNQDNDIITACIQSQRFEYLHSLLQAYPLYFKQHYFNGPEIDRKDNIERLKKSMESYHDESKETLIQLFTDLHIELSPIFLDSIGLSRSASIKMMS